MSDADRDGALPIPREELDPPTHLFAATGREHPHRQAWLDEHGPTEWPYGEVTS